MCCIQTQLSHPISTDSDLKQSDEVMKENVQVINCINVKTKSEKRFRISKIGNVEVVRVTILAFVRCHPYNIDICVCIA